MKYVNKGITFTCNMDIDEREADAYIQRGLDKYGTSLYQVVARIEANDEVFLEYRWVDHIPFERIRRITGYLVGTLDRFNDAKRAEEHDRVKHGSERM